MLIAILIALKTEQIALLSLRSSDQSGIVKQEIEISKSKSLKIFQSKSKNNNDKNKTKTTIKIIFISAKL